MDGTWYYGNQAPNTPRSGKNGGAVPASPSGGANAWWYRRKRGLETGGDAEALAKFLEDNPHPKALRGKKKTEVARVAVLVAVARVEAVTRMEAVARRTCVFHVSL